MDVVGALRIAADRAWCYFWRGFVSYGRRPDRAYSTLPTPPTSCFHILRLLLLRLLLFRLVLLRLVTDSCPVRFLLPASRFDGLLLLPIPTSSASSASCFGCFLLRLFPAASDSCFLLRLISASSSFCFLLLASLAFRFVRFLFRLPSSSCSYFVFFLLRLLTASSALCFVYSLLRPLPVPSECLLHVPVSASRYLAQTVASFTRRARKGLWRLLSIAAPFNRSFHLP